MSRPFGSVDTDSVLPSLGPDIIGCGLDFATGAAFYTKNGVPTGPVWPGMRTHEMYPTVGLRTPREVVKANFGQFPFKYDIASYFVSAFLGLVPCLRQVLIPATSRP